MITLIITTTSFLLFSKIVFDLVQFWFAPYLSPLRKLPGPSAKHWYFGWTTPDVIANLTFNLWKKHDVYGPVFFGRGVHRSPNLYIADKLAVNYIFQNHFSSSGPELFRRIPFRVHVSRSFFGSTILGVEEDVHRRQRRAILPAFTESAIRQASSIMYDVTQDLMNLMRKDLAGQKCYTQINITTYTRDVALDMIGRAGFGHDLGTLSKKAAEMNTLFLDVLKILTSPSFYCFLRFRIPWIRNLGKYFSAEEIKIRKYQKENKIYSDTLVKTAEEEMKKGTAEDDRNFLRFIKRASSNGASSIMTDKELRESVPVLLLGALETTATTITWAVHDLTRGADGIGKQERLRSELSANEFQGWQSDFDILNRMPYLEAVCTEVLRLHPAFGIISRVCWQDTVIPLSKPVILRDGTTTNKIPIKKGEHLHISTLGINRCTSIWGENANEFIPERWLRDDHIYFDQNLSSSNNSSLGGWNHLLTFGQGTRMCLGFRFALAEFKIILAHCIANFDWKQAIDPKTGKPFEIEPRGQKVIFASIKGSTEDDYSLPILVREIK